MVCSRCLRHAGLPVVYREVRSTPVTLSTILEVYTLEEILELNDKTEEDCLEYLVDQGYVKLPFIKPLEFED